MSKSLNCVLELKKRLAKEGLETPSSCLSSCDVKHVEIKYTWVSEKSGYPGFVYISKFREFTHTHTHKGEMDGWTH